MTRESTFLKGEMQFEKMVAFVHQAARDQRPIEEVERGLWRSLLVLGRALLTSYVEKVGPGDVGESLAVAGRVLRRLDAPHERRYVSVFGELVIPRYVYGTRETQKHEVVPTDALLALPEGDFSQLLQEWDQSFCVQNSYAESARTVERVLGIGQSVRSLEQMTRAMSTSVSAFRNQQPPPPAEEAGAIVVLTADGKGVPMRREKQADEPPRRARRQKGEKSNKKRMACVGAVYGIAPFVRTPEDVVDEVLRDARHADRPSPCHKQLRAELSRPIAGVEVNGKERIFDWFAAQLALRNPDGEQKVVCVMDGERALWKQLRTRVPEVVCILDLFHVLERVWDAAHCFHAEGSKAAAEFVSARLFRLLRGEVGYVVGGLKQMAKKRQLRGARGRQLAAAIGYLERNRRLLRYDEYLAAGYPIGSGVAEGACRHLVKDRLELTGMRWCVPGAQAMLDLRAVYINGDWDAFQKYRIRAARRQLYPYRAQVRQMYKSAA